MHFFDELRIFNNDYLFDGTSVYYWLKSMFVKQVDEEESRYLVSKILRHYLEYLTASILGNIRGSNNSRLSFILEIDQCLDSTTSEKQDYIFRMLDLMLGNFIRTSLGRNITYLTHEITCFISKEMTISIMVKPSRLSDTDKYHIHLDNIEEEGGWVSDRLRRRKYEYNEHH